MHPSAFAGPEVNPVGPCGGLQCLGQDIHLSQLRNQLRHPELTNISESPLNSIHQKIIMNISSVVQ